MTNLTGKSKQITALHQLGSVEFLRSGAYVRLNDIAKPFGKRLVEILPGLKARGFLTLHRL
ncbi:hypothetical protein QT972_28990, partial [Microcoleus sp. herbarium7]|uniref:hypothetical protein n=1 Tax=Microcoleus sp. herbarium7 TaxID=3055435 RepID=UPI002FD0F0C0